MRTIHNTTFFVNKNIEDEWMSYIKSTYIDKIKSVIEIKDYILAKVEQHNDEEHNTYSLQLIISEDEKDICIINVEKGCQNITDIFGVDCMHFHSILSEID